MKFQLNLENTNVNSIGIWARANNRSDTISKAYLKIMMVGMNIVMPSLFILSVLRSYITCGQLDRKYLFRSYKFEWENYNAIVDFFQNDNTLYVVCIILVYHGIKTHHSDISLKCSSVSFVLIVSWLPIHFYCFLHQSAINFGHFILFSKNWQADLLEGIRKWWRIFGS